MSNNKENLAEKISAKTATIGIVGIGYVGSNLAQATGRAGFKTIGLGRKADKVDKFNKANYLNVFATTDTTTLKNCDIICICVPTPLTKNKTPNLSYIKSATRMVSKFIVEGQLVILESSVAPGTTRSTVLPRLEKSGLKAGEDFFLGYSPERVDPGNIYYPAHKIPKVIAGINPQTTSLMRLFYEQVVAGVTEVSQIEAAELTKVFENVFRFVNISLVNELARLTSKLGLNTYEVINAAATKPFGFLAHYPSPGVGGDCIPVMPRYYLAAAKKAGVKTPIVKAAIAIDSRQPKLVVEKANEILGKGIKNGKPRILLVGVGYKKDMGDLRESVGLTIWKLLTEQQMEVYYHDPYVPQVNGTSSTEITNDFLISLDLIIITTNHSNVPYNDMVKTQVPILDTRHTFNGTHSPYIHDFA